MNSLDSIQYETYPDRCPVCGSHGMAPCYDAAGNGVPDHDGRPVVLASDPDPVSPVTGHRFSCSTYATLDASDCDCA